MLLGSYRSPWTHPWTASSCLTQTSEYRSITILFAKCWLMWIISPWNQLWSSYRKKQKPQSLRKFWCGDLFLGPQLFSQNVFGPHTIVASIVNFKDWVWSGWSPPRKRLAHHDVPNHSQKMLFWTPFYARGLIQMVWISCKRLAQQFDLNQFQKEIVANDFPFCKEQQKILVVLDLLFAKKSHTIKKHRKNCECCPGHFLIVYHYSSI